jgi:very-short-patch-repair endonuclease
MAGPYEAFGRCIDRCESFIERRFAVALLFSEQFTFVPAEGVGVVGEDRHGIVLGQQVPVAGYRLDFAMKRGEGEARIAIELDGHAYHDASPDTAERDRVRDRVLTAMGWRVIRFTGREVVRDAMTCARTAHELMLAVSGGPAAPMPTIAKAVPRAQLALRTTG